MTQPRKHRHSDMMRRWLDDDSLEVEMMVGHEEWAIASTPIWQECQQYRFKPKMIKCGDMEFPEPMRVAPAIGTGCWLVTPAGNSLTAHYAWMESTCDLRWLGRGITHTTKSAAEAHARALIALTESKS